MRNLRCPQCDIHRFYVKNESGNTVLVTINELYEINTVHPTDTLEGFDLSVIYCLGCSWSGSPKSLRGGKNKRHP